MSWLNATISNFFSCNKRAISRSMVDIAKKSLKIEECRPPLLSPLALYLKKKFKLNANKIREIESLTDLSCPGELFPFARAMPRRIICHFGPTNSGKTYAAIEALKSSKNGVYCAPLRLLAQEMYEKLNAAGVACALRTGEITKPPKDSQLNSGTNSSSFDWNSAPIVSCTVEMLNLRKVYDVAVIDEIQMLADVQRGWAFTAALLGCNARTIYLCGEGAARDLIEGILHEVGEVDGDRFEVVNFDRLNPLKLLPSALSHPAIKYESGDCVVTFSRRSIFQLKEEIERKRGGRKVAVVYGALPAESRAMQAALFNNSSSVAKADFDVLVASDAIGMGLNLLKKFDGKDMILVPSHQIRQIAGRAGRFNTRHEMGLVTCMRDSDYSSLQTALNDQTPPSYKQACLMPPFEQIERLKSAFPNFHFIDVLDAFEAFSRPAPHYFLARMQTTRKLLELLRDVDLAPLNLEDLFSFLSAPVKVDDEAVASTFLSYARYFVKGNACPVSTLVPIPNSASSSQELLQLAESAHKALEIYLWLNTRFPHHFPHRKEAEERAEDCCTIIENSLTSSRNKHPKES